jgi:hypothetical protein
VGTSHGGFGKVDELIVLGSLPRPLVRDAHGGEAEGVVRLDLAGLFRVTNCVVVLVQFPVQHGQGHVGQAVLLILLEQFVQFGNRLFVLARLFERLGLLIQFVSGRHRLNLRTETTGVSLAP